MGADARDAAIAAAAADGKQRADIARQQVLSQGYSAFVADKVAQEMANMPSPTGSNADARDRSATSIAQKYNVAALLPIAIQAEKQQQFLSQSPSTTPIANQLASAPLISNPGTGSNADVRANSAVVGVDQILDTANKIQQMSGGDPANLAEAMNQLNQQAIASQGSGSLLSGLGSLYSGLGTGALPLAALVGAGAMGMFGAGAAGAEAAGAGAAGAGAGTSGAIGAGGQLMGSAAPIMMNPVTGSYLTAAELAAAPGASGAAGMFSGVGGGGAIAPGTLTNSAVNTGVSGAIMPTSTSSIIPSAAAIPSAATATPTLADTYAAMNAAVPGGLTTSGSVAVDQALASAVQSNVLTPVAANAASAAVSSGVMNANTILNGLATAGFGTGSTSDLLNQIAQATGISTTTLANVGSTATTALSGYLSQQDAIALQNQNLAAQQAMQTQNQQYATAQTQAQRDYLATISAQQQAAFQGQQAQTQAAITGLTPLQQNLYSAQAGATQQQSLTDAQLANIASINQTGAAGNYSTGLGAAAGLFGAGVNAAGTTYGAGLGAAAGQYGAGLTSAAGQYGTGLGVSAGQYGTGMLTAAQQYGAGLGAAGQQYANVLGTAGTQLGTDITNATMQAAALQNFNPYGITPTTRFGTSTGTGYNLTPEAKAQQDYLMAISNNALGQYGNAQAATAPMGSAAQTMFGLGQGYLQTNPQTQAAQYMAEQQALLAPTRERQLAQLQAQMQAQGRGGLAIGGTSTGMGATNPQLEAFLNAQRMQDLQLAAQATQGGQQYAQFGANMIGQGAQTLQGMYGTQQAAYQPYATALGGAQNLETLGQNALTLGTGLNQLQAQYGQAAGNTLMQGLGQAAQARYTGATGAAQVPFQTAQQGLGAQYQAAQTGLGAGLTSAQTGLGAQYQAAGTGLGAGLTSAQTGLGAQYQGSLTGLGTNLTAAQQGLQTQYNAALNPAQYANYLAAQQAGIGGAYQAQLGVGAAQAPLQTQGMLAQQQANVTSPFATQAAQIPAAGQAMAPWGQAMNYQSTGGNPLAGMLTGASNELKQYTQPVTGLPAQKILTPEQQAAANVYNTANFGEWAGNTYVPYNPNTWGASNGK